MDYHQIYQPLDPAQKEIRVLVLEPGPCDSDDMITGTLVRTTLYSLPVTEILSELEYETISYVWGDSSLRAKIYLDGQPVNVPQSSEAVLRRMRFEDRPRNLWIDAICINQRDLAERSSQVAMMSEVYSHGTCNLIYLGEDDGFVERALNSVRLLLDTEIGEVTSNGRSLLETTTDRNGDPAVSSTPISVEIDYDAIGMLYSKPWFSRLWVVQEAAVSRYNRCFCGTSDFDLVDILLVAAWINYKSTFLPPGALQDLMVINSPLRILDCMGTPDSVLTLAVWKDNRAVYLLGLALGFETTEPLDKVFAMLGLLKAQGQNRIEDFPVDYTMALADVLTQAWVNVMKTSRSPLYSLNNLSHRTDEDIHVEGLPSWVPRSYRKFDGYLDADKLASFFDTSDGIKRTPSFALPPPGSRCFGRMSVQGFLIDEIVQAFETDTPRDRFYIEDLKDDFLLPLQRSCSTSLWVDRSNVYVLTAGAWHNRTPIQPPQIEASKRLLFKIMNGNYLPKWVFDLQFESDAEDRLLSECVESIFRACKGRLICETSRRLLALAPKVAQSGDIIVQLLGMYTPCVLRPCGEFFEFIGEAYVHGVMQGEATREWQAAGGIAETYTLI